MNTKKLLLIFFALSIVGFIVGSVLTSSYEFGICFADLSNNTFDVSCHSLMERIGNPLFYGMAALALVFLVLLFTPSAFESWKKFARWFVPLAALIFIFYPEPGSGDFFSPYPEQVFKWVSVLYVIISLIIIFRSRKFSS